MDWQVIHDVLALLVVLLMAPLVLLGALRVVVEHLLPCFAELSDLEDLIEDVESFPRCPGGDCDEYQNDKV